MCQCLGPDDARRQTDGQRTCCVFFATEGADAALRLANDADAPAGLSVSGGARPRKAESSSRCQNSELSVAARVIGISGAGGAGVHPLYVASGALPHPPGSVDIRRWGGAGAGDMKPAHSCRRRLAESSEAGIYGWTMFCPLCH